MQSTPSEMPSIEANVRFKGAKVSPRRLHRLDFLANRPEVRKPYILSLEEQHKFFNELPIHLRQMAVFQVNTGCREKELCELQWSWERAVPEFNTSVFMVPCVSTTSHVVVLNNQAKVVLEQQRGLHPTHVFAYNGHPVRHITIHFAWKRAREKVGLPQLSILDLRRTFQQRLDEAGVGLQDRQELLGWHQRTSDYSNDYSDEQLCHWIKAANKICARA